MKKRRLPRPDPFLTALLGLLVAGMLIPVSESASKGINAAATWAVMGLFFLYGARLHTVEVISGLRNYRLQGAVLACTFLLFPLLGLAVYPLLETTLGASFALGMLYLSLLPSTVQSSVAFTSIAGGNVAGAVCAATVSNTVGVVLTPLLSLWLLGAWAGIGAEAFGGVALKLLAPFIAGQLAQPLVGDSLRRRVGFLRLYDRATVLAVVAGGVSTASSQGLWEGVSAMAFLGLLAASAVLLAIMLATTWWGGQALGLKRGDRVALLMCGSKKSLGTGLPMAAIMFPLPMIAAVTIPVIVFHQLQLLVCAYLARRLAAKPV